jgi:chloramphenicol 3-O phosphotransferase
MSKSSIQVIYLNGPSSSGKTVLAKALQKAFDEPFLHVGIDKIIGWMPEKINDWTGGEACLGYSWKSGADESGHPIQDLQIGPFAKKMEKTFQEVVLTLVKSGHHLIIDDVSFGKDEVDEWRKVLQGYNVIWVGVNAPLHILEQREQERGNRIEGSARGQFHKVHVGVSYDLEIDTHHVPLADNIAKIQSAIDTHENAQSILIRPVKQTDIPKIVSKYSFPWSTPDSTQKIWDAYFQEQQSGIRTVVLIEKNQDILGYGSFLRNSESASFVSRNIPEINAVWIHEAHRKQGLATRLIQWMEELAVKEGYQQIGIGVGLYADYGPAQKLYYHLGFVPDGHGITYSGQPTIPGQSYPLDDELVLWLIKKLV